MENIFKNIDLSGIEKAVIQDDCIARTFRSGGGLRVMRIEKKDHENTLVGYGEHVTFLPMLGKASENYNLGSKIFESEFYVGSKNTDCMLDVWTCIGGNVYIEKDSEGLKASLKFFTGRIVCEIAASNLADAFEAIETWLGSIDIGELNNTLLDESLSSKEKGGRVLVPLIPKIGR